MLSLLLAQLSHPPVTTGKTIVLTKQTFVSKVMPLLFNTLYRFVIAFLLSVFSWLQTLSAAILEPRKIKSVTVSIFFPIYLPWSDGTGWHDLSFSERWLSSQLFHSPLLPSSWGSLAPLHFLPIEWYHLHIWGCRYSSEIFNSSLWFVQSCISHDVLCIEVK